MEEQGYLTTHVLDTANGCPAAGVVIELCSLDDSGPTHLQSTITNSDGRTDSPLIERGNLQCGTYELVFQVADYFAGHTAIAVHAFIDTVPIRFGVDDDSSHYHVPLLVSPFSYSTYRGS